MTEHRGLNHETVTKFGNSECRYVACPNAVCIDAECRYPECRGAM